MQRVSMVILPETLSRRRARNEKMKANENNKRGLKLNSSKSILLSHPQILAIFDDKSD